MAEAAWWSWEGGMRFEGVLAAVGAIALCACADAVRAPGGPDPKGSSGPPGSGSSTSETGHPGIQIGQSGTNLDCSSEVPLEDPSVPAEDLPYSAEAWSDQLAKRFVGTLSPSDYGTLGLELPLPAPLDLSLDLGPLALHLGECGPAYLSHATLALDAGELSAEAPVLVLSSGPASATWREEVSLDELQGTLDPPDMGTLEITSVALRIEGQIDEETSWGDLSWLLAATDGYDYLVPIGVWSATAP